MKAKWFVSLVFVLISGLRVVVRWGTGSGKNYTVGLP